MCTADEIVETIKHILKEFRLNMRSRVGIGTDASVLTGFNNGVRQKLKTEVTNLILVRCVCHRSSKRQQKAQKVRPVLSNQSYGIPPLHEFVAMYRSNLLPCNKDEVNMLTSQRNIVVIPWKSR